MYFVCASLHFAVRVSGDTQEVQDLLGEQTPHASTKCPECHASLLRSEFLDDTLATAVAPVLRVLTPYETHLALEGMGFPEEQECSVESLRKVLLSQPIRSISAKDVPYTQRSSLESITLEDGATIFLAASGYGALVYRIRKANPYTSKESL